MKQNDLCNCGRGHYEEPFCETILNLDRWLDVDFRYEPAHEIFNNLVCATSKASDQPVHTHSLIRAFASRLNIL